MIVAEPNGRVAIPVSKADLQPCRHHLYEGHAGQVETPPLITDHRKKGKWYSPFLILLPHTDKPRHNREHSSAVRQRVSSGLPSRPPIFESGLPRYPNHKVDFSDF